MSDRSASRLSVPTMGNPTSRSRTPNSLVNNATLSPLISRSYSQASTPPSFLSYSGPSTPFETPPQTYSTNASPPVPSGPRRLLMPTVCSSNKFTGSPRILQHKASPSKISRSRAGSMSNLGMTEQSERAVSVNTPDWIGEGRKFEIVEENIELGGYQIYAVEKWVVDRRRPVIVLTVFTGDPKHKIIVTALSPLLSLSQPEAQLEWDKAIRHLRRDGARPRETGRGVLMVTSLANFRSDYTIVHIPRGNFLEVKEQLYTNINLLRMGCSGRSALTLEEPSDTTKDRFILMYNIPDKAHAKSGASFNTSVLELVKLIQAALAIFDMFDIAPEERNGLLCDITSEGIKRWVTEIGEPCMKVEHMERVADPTVVAALFSLILTIRNKLHALGHYVPKDPFLDPLGFTKALSAYQTSKPHGHAHNLVHSHGPRPSSPGPSSSPPLGTAAPGTNASPNPPTGHLSQQLVESIQNAYEKKARQSESYKVHRVLKSKLDDLASDLRTGGSGDEGPGGTSGAASSVNPTVDLNAFVKVVVGGSKEAPNSLRYLWTGRPDEVQKKRREKEAAWSDAEREREERERWRGGEKDGWGKDWRDRGRDKDRDERSREREALSSGDESESKFGRVQRKLESWAVLGRPKKISVDFGTLGKNLLDSQNRIGPSERSRPSSTVPSVRISGDPDEDEPLSSGQASPAYGTSPSMMLGIGSYALAEHSASELSEYDRRVIEFNRKRPPKRPHLQARIVSWSDPFSAQDLDEDVETEGKLKARATLRVENEGEPEGLASDTDMEGVRRRRTTIRRLRRCHSFDATSQFKDMYVLPIERMRIDVELCGELLVMMRREQHLANIAACLAVLTARLSQTNTHLRAEHEAARPALDELRARAQVLHQVEAQRTRVDALTQETQALEYESAQFLVGDLWHMAMQPRRRVLGLRERAFGTGRRHPQGVRGAHGRFDRVQWTLDGKERLVDVLGRTESEAEEEDGLPGNVAFDDSESGDEVDAVNHQTLRPTWLLRFFNYWGSRWGASKGSPKDRDSTPARESESEMEGVANTASTTSLPETSAHMRSRPSIQHPNSS